MNERITKICEQIESLPKPILIAIDGRCASGKSTLASVLAETFDANLVSMDDFFLRKEQRTPQRFQEIGGNVDRERIQSEVILPWIQEQRLSYAPFDCSCMELGPCIQQDYRPILILEGSYSLHPALRPYVSFSIFVDIDPELQSSRLRKRETPESFQRFQERWIPLEETYFSSFDPTQIADIILKNLDL